VTITREDRKALETLERRLRALLPEVYADSYETVQPVSMGSAGLKYDADGRVAWDEIWATFCDLAMAGGPPHKGTLLAPATQVEIDAQPDQYRDVVEEICRGVTMVADLEARRAPIAGWVRVVCFNEGMAGWLLRAIAMENVDVRSEGATLDLPAAPHYRLAKEIKNVITVIAKTCHYWTGHVSRARQQAIAKLFATMADEAPLVEPARASEGVHANGSRVVSVTMADVIRRETGLRRSNHRYVGWLGLECPSVRAAIWMMRGMVVSNVLSRREGAVLFVPVNPVRDPGGARVVGSLVRVHRLAAARDLLQE
jgi:sirohydrochlorin cobaltochelatase